MAQQAGKACRRIPPYHLAPGSDSTPHGPGRGGRPEKGGSLRRGLQEPRRSSTPSGSEATPSASEATPSASEAKPRLRL
ncbi:unnamed protein product [Arctogadus glacialis]